MDSSQVNRLRKTKEGCKHLLSIFQRNKKRLYSCNTSVFYYIKYNQLSITQAFEKNSA